MQSNTTSFKSLIINVMKLPVDGYPKNRKSIRYAVQ